MTLPTNELLAELLTAHPAPRLSICQPTHRLRQENEQDPVRFRNLAKELEASLGRRYPEVDARPRDVEHCCRPAGLPLIPADPDGEIEGRKSLLLHVRVFGYYETDLQRRPSS